MKNMIRNLTPAAQRMYRGVLKQYELDAQQAALLLQGLEAWDLSNAAKDEIRRDGLMVGGRRHPLFEVANKSDATFRACWKELFRDGAGEAGRPPAAF